MKKRIVWITIALVLSTCLLVALVGNAIYKMWYMEGFIDNKLETYTNKQLLQYDGGAEALAFFPEQDAIQNAENIYFHYQDNRPKSTLMHVYDSFFLLDVRYSEEDYNTFTQQFDYDPDSGLGGYSKVMSDSSVDKYCKGIYCNDAENTVRYILFYGAFEKNTSLSSLVMWNATDFF